VTSLEPARRAAHVLLDALLAGDLTREIHDPNGHAIVLALLELNQVGAVELVVDDDGRRSVDATMLLAGALSAMTGLLAGLDDLDHPLSLEQVIAEARTYVDGTIDGTDPD